VAEFSTDLAKARITKGNLPPDYVKVKSGIQAMNCQFFILTTIKFRFLFPYG